MTIQFYVGLDFHKNVAELCIQDKHGKVQDRARMKTELVAKYAATLPSRQAERYSTWQRSSSAMDMKSL